MKKFVETGVVATSEKPVHHRFAHFAPSAENIAIVSESVKEEPNVSGIRLPYSTLWHILHLDLHPHSYKVQLTQLLKPGGGRQFCEQNFLHR